MDNMMSYLTTPPQPPCRHRGTPSFPSGWNISAFSQRRSYWAPVPHSPVQCCVQRSTADGAVGGLEAAVRLHQVGLGQPRQVLQRVDILHVTLVCRGT